MQLFGKLARLTAMVSALASFTICFAPGARAAFIMTMTQVGNDVVQSGTGTLDVSALTPSNQYDDATFYPTIAGVIGGSTSPTNDVYYHGISGPKSFGTGAFTYATSGSGDTAGVLGGFNVGFTDSAVVVPVGYVSGSTLSNNNIYTNTTFAGLGIAPGTYVWTWGSVDAQNADSFTLQVGPIPEPAGLALFSAGLLVLGLVRRRTSR